jgi:SAM-dependent methyltransferase
MNRLKAFLRNLRFLSARELRSVFEAQEQRIDAFQQRADERADAYERALDLRLDERFTGIEERLDERSSNFEAAQDARLDKRFVNLEQRSDERFATIEQQNDAQQAKLAKTLDQRFDKRVRAADNRFDDRFARTERQIDERFQTLEQRLDERMETHEKRTDYNLKLNRADIIERADVMLQIFEQRLDQQRRELKALRQQLAQLQGTTPAENQAESIAETNGQLATIDPKQILAESEPAQQVQSFRKLAQASGLIGANKLKTTDATLYQKILDWKRVSAEGFNNFTPDEQEVVDYLLSFISDDAERNYTRQHLRRFLSTLQRIPPPQRSTDRLLELGSLLHLAPVIKKFCGYNEVCCADTWEGAEKLSHETLRQVNGSESHTIELRNFNVEAEPYPYPDGHFRVVLCCELIEHLQHDPLHMLWECNRILQPDGFLLVTTPNITSARSIEGVLIGCTPYLLSQYNLTTPADQHNREYAPLELGIALAAAGFTVIELETEDVWLRSNPAILKLLEEVNLPTDMRGDNIFALARKTSEPLERYPQELYVE